MRFPNNYRHHSVFGKAFDVLCAVLAVAAAKAA